MGKLRISRRAQGYPLRELLPTAQLLGIFSILQRVFRGGADDPLVLQRHFCSDQRALKTLFEMQRSCQASPAT